MRQLVQLLRPYRNLVIMVLMLSIAKSGAELAIPQMVRYVMDVVLPKADLRLLSQMALIGVGFFAFKAVVQYLTTIYIFDISHRVSKQLRIRLFDHIESLPLSYFITRPKGTVVSKVITDVNATERLVLTMFSRVAGEALEVAAVVLAIFLFNPWLGLALATIVPILVLILYFNARQIKTISKSIQKQVGLLTARVTEAIDAIVVTRVYGQQPFEIERFRKQTEEYRLMNMERRKNIGRMESSVDFFGNLGLILIFWVGGYLLFQGKVSLGILTANVMYLQMMLRPLRSIVNMHMIYQEGMASLERLEELLAVPSEASSRSIGLMPAPVSGQLRFERVSFHYPNGEEVLHQIDFELNPGETIALVGPSGAGKTSIVQLIPRLYAPSSGKILLDGIDLQEYDLAYLRSQMAYVSQDPVLFSGTIYDNIAYGRPGAEPDEVIQAAKAANAHEFIIRLPNEYRAEIGERGVKLSGGQKQRLAIARAIVKNPKILILDEATSFQDSESEKKIQESLRFLARGRTCLVIAHRLSTVVKADRILVIEDGRIVQSGTHEQLIRSGGLYNQLYRTQFRGVKGAEPDQFI